MEQLEDEAIGLSTEEETAAAVEEEDIEELDEVPVNTRGGFCGIGST